MTAEESANLDSRFLYEGPHLYRRQQSSVGFSSRHAEKRHRDDGFGQQLLVADSSRYVEAQIKNRMELTRLNERRQALDQQQRRATTTLDRNKRRFVEEMANVGRTTVDLSATVPRPGYRRRRSARARPTAAIDNRNSYGEDDVDYCIPALVALQLYDRDDESRHQRAPRPSTTVTGRVNSAGVGVSRARSATTAKTPSRRLPENFQLTDHRYKIAARRGYRSASGRPPVARQEMSVRRTPTATSLRRANSTLSYRPRPSATGTLTNKSTADRQNTGTDRSSANADGIAADHGRESSSRWRKDLKREAPPALFGYRPSLNFHVAFSQAESRRRRLVALQTRQTAPLAAGRQVHSYSQVKQ